MPCNESQPTKSVEVEAAKTETGWTVVYAEVMAYTTSDQVRDLLVSRGWTVAW